MALSLQVSDDTAFVFVAIANRASNLYADNGAERSALNIYLDLVATHANGCKLEAKRLYDADDFNLMHDIAGINRHLDRETGKLGGCFLPRFAAKQEG